MLHEYREGVKRSLLRVWVDTRGALAVFSSNLHVNKHISQGLCLGHEPEVKRSTVEDSLDTSGLMSNSGGSYNSQLQDIMTAVGHAGFKHRPSSRTSLGSSLLP